MTTTSSSDERKFAVFSALSIQLHAESIGISDLPDNVLLKLAEDVSYRVREMASKSCEFMRHSRRKKLKSCDIDRALHWSNVAPTTGAPNSTQFNSFEGLHFMPDQVVDLKDIAFRELPPNQLEEYSSLTANWLSPDDINAQSSKKHTKEKMELGPEPLLPNTDDFTTYYSSLVESILSDNTKLFKEILKDLHTNPRIGRIIPYLVNFTSGANLVSHDPKKLTWMLQTVRALFMNKYVSVQLYLQPLLNSVMYCVMGSLAASINPTNDLWILRDYGALLITRIIHTYPCETDVLLEHLINSVVTVLSDSTHPLCSHYGAATCIAALGVKVIEKLLPICEDYLTTTLLPLIEDTSSGGDHMKDDAYMVFGAITRCIERLHYQHDDPDDAMSYYLIPNLSPAVGELLGDSLAVRLPLHKYRLKRDTDVSSERKSFANIVGSSRFVCQVFTRRDLQPRSLPKYSVSEVFQPCLKQRARRPIIINFGRMIPVKSRRKHVPAARSSSSTNYQYNLLRTFRPRSKRTHISAELLSWL